MYDRLGLHILGGYSGRLGKPRVVKCVDPSGVYLRQLRVQVGPDCLIVARWDEPVYLGTPETAAQQWFARHAAQMDVGTGYATDPKMVFEGANEVHDDQAEAFCRFELERLRLLHASHYHAAVGSWSVGVPDLATWQTYSPLLRALRHGDVVSLHEYWVDRADIGNPWHCCRWSLVPELQGVPIAVTEAGRDVVEGRGNAGWQGYVSEDDYLAELADYSDLIARYPNVVGATVFTGGTILDPRWSKFNVNGIWDRVVAGYSPVTGGAPVPELFPIDGRHLDATAFRTHVAGLDLSWARRVVIHHTASDPRLWRDEESLQVLRRMYAGYGWPAGPHAYIDATGIWLFSPLSAPGVGVADRNGDTLHLEIVANMSVEIPTDGRVTLAAQAAAILLERLGLGTEALTYHSAITPPEHPTECPGKLFVPRWAGFVSQVQGMLDYSDAMRLEFIQQAQAHSIRIYKDAALFRHAKAQGYMLCSDEFRQGEWACQWGYDTAADERVLMRARAQDGWKVEEYARVKN